MSRKRRSVADAAFAFSILLHPQPHQLVLRLAFLFREAMGLPRSVISPWWRGMRRLKQGDGKCVRVGRRASISLAGVRLSRARRFQATVRKELQLLADRASIPFRIQTRPHRAW